ncbi:MAG TPA: hypothetical protein VFS88_01475 [Micavibrio sp.]|nr:hypothetical protein [Micavibrio sp.]
MAAVRQDIAGNDVNGRVDAFMSSRESLAAQPNVLAFMDAQSNTQYIPFSPGPILSQENMLLMKSGYVNASLHSRAAADGDTSRGDSEEAEKEKDAHMRRVIVNAITAQTMTYEGMTFTYEEVDSNLTKAVEQQEKFLERELPEVKRKDLLFVDDKGEIVPADTPGAHQVMTAEEKRKVQDQNGDTNLKAADEVTMVNGRMVSVKDVITNMAIEDRASLAKDTLKKIESGEMKLEDVHKEMRPHLV